MLRRPFGSFTSSWREMERLRREMNRLFADVRPGLAAAPCYPAMNVWTNQDGAIVTAELPGFTPEDIDISVVNDTLTLSGNRSPEELEEGETYHRRERSCGRFSRAFQLPFAVETGEVEATFEKGVLKVTLPRAEADKPKKITVKTG
jgi:HSP20 family protein